jgi:ectoine hydroxylase-related dioxygenase (phytanoyl-CoA dioxygenase family)
MSAADGMTSEQRLIYESQGFLHLRGVVEPRLVEQLRRAFDTAAAEYAEQRRAEVAQGRADAAYFDIPNILDRGDCFIDLVDLPGVIPVLIGAIGPDIQLNHTHARVFPPGRTFTAPWHSDLTEVLGIDLAHSPHFFAKVHFYFEDLAPDQGCLAFIPGTHRLPVDHPRPVIDDPDTSPAVVKIVPKAGDAVLFNTHVLHMALDNTSPKTRKSLIYAYSHFWVKNYANSVPANLEKYATTQLRRQLFGVEDEGVSYFDQRYNCDLQPDWSSSFRSASRRLLKRLRKSSSLTLPR